MKAIYINLDPYLAAYAEWFKGANVDPDTGITETPPPAFHPLPLAVALPLGESVAIYLPGSGGAGLEPSENAATVDGVTVGFVYDHNGEWPEGTIAYNVVPGLSSLAPSAKYAVLPVNGDSLSLGVRLGDEYGMRITIPFTVLVRREQPSGPVDLVDFAPPLTAMQINTALGGTGAAEGQPLKGVSLASATNAPAPTTEQVNAALGGLGPLPDAPLNGVMLAGASIAVRDSSEPVPEGVTLTTIGVCNGPYSGTWNVITGDTSNIPYTIGPDHGA